MDTKASEDICWTPACSLAVGHAPYLLLQNWRFWWFLRDQDPKVTHNCHQVLSGQQGLQGHPQGAQGAPNGRVTAEFTWLLLLLFLLVLGHRDRSQQKVGAPLSESSTPNPAPCPPLHPGQVLPSLFLQFRYNLVIVLSQYPTFPPFFFCPCLSLFVAVFSSGSSSTGHESTCPERGAGPGSLPSQPASQRECDSTGWAFQQLFPLHPARPHPHLLLHNWDNRSSLQVGLQPQQVLDNVFLPVAPVDDVCPGLSRGGKHLYCVGTQKSWEKTSPSPGQKDPQDTAGTRSWSISPRNSPADTEGDILVPPHPTKSCTPALRDEDL